MDTTNKFRFIHIPKTGGTTFRVNLLNAHKAILMGHEVNYAKLDKNITIIRNPIDQTCSMYKEQTEKIDFAFADWFIEKNWNFQTKWLMDKLLGVKEVIPTQEHLEKIKKILDGFYAVLLTENLETDLKPLLKELGVELTLERSNATKKDFKPSESDCELIREKSNLDFELYEYIKNGRNNSKRS